MGSGNGLPSYGALHSSGSYQQEQNGGAPRGTGREGRVGELRSEVDDLKNIMVRNIDTLAERGEKLELLVDRSEQLEAGVRNLKRGVRNF